jgi:dihydrofolate reductase
MRKVITGAMVSLDGVMQAPGGPEEDPSGGFRFGGWVAPLFDEVGGKAIDTLFTPPYDLLLGRKTYEIFAAYWPYQGEESPIAKSFNAVTKYVVSRKGIPLTWKGSVLLRDAAADVARLKKENGPNLVTQGSTDLIQTLLSNDLIDELHLFTCPLLLGRGKRLFREGTKPAALKLVESTISSTGVTIGKYVRAGDVKTGDFGAHEPSDLEIKRRERLKREG